MPRKVKPKVQYAYMTAEGAFYGNDDEPTLFKDVLEAEGDADQASQDLGLDEEGDHFFLVEIRPVRKMTVHQTIEVQGVDV